VVVKPDEEVVDEAELFEPLKRLGDERLLFRARHARGCRRRQMMRKKRAERYWPLTPILSHSGGFSAHQTPSWEREMIGSMPLLPMSESARLAGE
jgi:hypothetical protein